VPIQRSSSLSRRTRIEVPVAFPHERRVRSSGPVRMPECFRELERVRARRDHQRSEGVPQIMELEPLEVGASRRLVLSRHALQRLREHIGPEIVRVPHAVRPRRRKSEPLWAPSPLRPRRASRSLLMPTHSFYRAPRPGGHQGSFQQHDDEPLV